MRKATKDKTHQFNFWLLLLIV